MINILFLSLAMAVSLADSPYSYQTYSATDSGSLEIGVTIKPNSGWKWNADYPSKFKVNTGKSDNAWRSFGKKGITAVLDGSHKLENVVVIANFSICNQTACRVMRNQEFRFSEKNLLKPCQTCHGKDLNGKKKSPAIRGVSYEKLYGSMTTDVPKKMNRIASKLTELEKQAISRYISELGGGK